MNFVDYFKTILGSAPRQWKAQACWGLGSGPSFRERSMITTGPGDKWSLEVESHSNVAVYRDDLSISMAWGIPHAQDFKQQWHASFPDPSASSFFIDFFYNSALVYREVGVAVDGGRTDLPLPQRAGGGLRVPKNQDVFFRLFNSLLDQTDYDQDFRQAGFQVDPALAWPE